MSLRPRQTGTTNAPPVDPDFRGKIWTSFRTPFFLVLDSCMLGAGTPLYLEIEREIYYARQVSDGTLLKEKWKGDERVGAQPFYGTFSLVDASTVEVSL